MTANHCEHYSYQSSPEGGGPVCAVGIDIHATFRPCWPCFTGNRLPASSATCDKFLAPTPEQLAERERHGEESAARILKAVDAIEQWEKAHGTVLGKIICISCPCCCAEDGLRFVRDRYHLTAQCETPQCVKFRGSCR